MSDYYRAEDLDRFPDVGKHSSELFKKFMDWNQAALIHSIQAHNSVDKLSL